MAFGVGATFAFAYHTAGSLLWLVAYHPTVRTVALIAFIAYLMRANTTTPAEPIASTPPAPSTQEQVRSRLPGTPSDASFAV
jgi:hypothetical protein